MALTDEPFAYVTTTGRVTGLPRQIEIWFVMAGGFVYILAEHGHDAQWVKNIVKDGRVKVRIATLTFDATARVLDPDRDAETCRIARDLASKKYGWGDGLPVEIRPDSPLAEPIP
jgi:deazaflavin-dependent oxidoreductase (nitroreductase family)